MKKILVSVIAVLAISFGANAANYTIDENAIDAMIENSVEVSPLALVSEAPAGATVSSDDKTPVVSFILCTFLGGFGVHRHYLGTTKWMWALYTFTFGGIFGIVPFVDWIMLLVGIVEGNVSQYQGNMSFIMWA